MAVVNAARAGHGFAQESLVNSRGAAEVAEEERVAAEVEAHRALQAEQNFGGARFGFARPVEVGGGRGGCGHWGKLIGPANIAAVRDCCERRKKSTSRDAGLRGRIFFKRAFPVYLSSVMCSLFITLFAGCLLCPRTYGALSYTH